MTSADGSVYEVPVDITTPNPNGFEMDNLYLDMNGIVHPCTHPEGKPAPATEEEMMLEIFMYTERIVNMIRPRKLLFMAIDGVAPRAKMNQQRSRRFRAAQEAKEKEEKRLEGIAIFEAMGKTVSDETKNATTWDSNAITPGTPFMALLADSLRYWVVKKLSEDPGWKDLEVIISDASVPGEGEHKIMDFIRRQRISKSYDPNTKHVIYGLDADLIMLALATHEPHFRVLREDVFAQDNQKGCRNCGQEGHFAAQCTVDKANPPDSQPVDKPLADTKPFIFLDVSILREYLEMELDVRAPFQFDFERAIDDWILLIFFVGNDFLPHLPSLEIREGAIDMLVGIWKRELYNMRGYLTNHGHIELQHEERQEQNAKRRKLEAASTANTEMHETTATAVEATSQHSLIISSHLSEVHMDSTSIRDANKQALQALRSAVMKAPVLDSKPDTENSNGTGGYDGLSEVEEAPHAPGLDVMEEDNGAVDDPLTTSNGIDDNAAARPLKRKRDEMELDETEEAAFDEGDDTPSLAMTVNPDGSVQQVDSVRLWEPGYKERYYRQKFQADASDVNFRQNVAKHYIEGLCWVLHYYYQGTPSWQWYYPYHFAPFASDFEGVDRLNISFEKGAPFKPFEQLMGVFPPASRSHIPLPLQDLMVNQDSPILDFYPQTFDIDMNGKRMAWQGVALLPFIDERRLLEAVEPLYPQLTSEEHIRNSWGNNSLFIGDTHPLFASVIGIYGKGKVKEAHPIDVERSRGLAGSIQADPNYVPGTTYSSPLHQVGHDDIFDNRSIAAFYFYPKQVIPHRSRLLPNVRLPERALTPADYEHVQRGGRGRGDAFRRPLSRNHEPRGYIHDYSNTQTHWRSTGWRPPGAGRGEPDYSVGSFNGSIEPILDFQVPRGLHFHVSKSPNPVFKTTYSLNALPNLNGSLGYIFTSCDLGLESSADVYLHEIVQHFKVYDQPRAPEPRPEVWLGGERVDQRYYLMYGRLYVPTGRLDALYSTRLGGSWQLVAAAISEQKQLSSNRIKNRRPESVDHSNILLNLQHDRGKWCTEYTFSVVDGLCGARMLYNFGKRAGEDGTTRESRRERRVDEEEAMDGGLKGRISAGAELYFSAKEKSGGISTAVRFTTVPESGVADAEGRGSLAGLQPPTTVTAVINPILGHISAAYASQVSQDLAVCSRFDFNAYSYESEWTIGTEWWVRKQIQDGAQDLEPASQLASRRNEALQGVLKAKISTNYDISMYWQGRLAHVLVGVGVISDLRNRTRPIRALGLEMSLNANHVANSPRGRGRGAARGRTGRGRGRGRPLSMSLYLKETGEDENHALDSAAVTAHDQFPIASKRRPSHRTTNPRAPVISSDSIPMDGTGRTREKELPPHIAGAAVDAQTLASRVQELAISGHKHSSSMESRFTMSLNWADEEDDPDSLPSLDEWKIPKPIVTSGDEATTGSEPSSQNQDTTSLPAASTHERTVDDVAPSSLSQADSTASQEALNTVVNKDEDSIRSYTAPHKNTQQSIAAHGPPKVSGGGTAASIWAPNSSVTTAVKRGGQQRYATRGRTNHHGTPGSLSHQCVPSELPSDTKEAQPTSAPPVRSRRPHARPIISSDALAQISRTLGQRASS
ncbi:5'-3' exoribonuclease 2 [Serendipita sp. 399]|nr:5'-3' exoribonuclease 2 [Serendipita sp. 399]